jgi:hypothetical protein
MKKLEELDDPAVSALRRVIAEAKQRWSLIGWVTHNLLSRAPPCFRRQLMKASRWFRLHLQPLARTNPQCPLPTVRAQCPVPIVHIAHWLWPVLLM